ncbi:MAG: Multidrug resistance protein Stp [Stenotrophomonas maltophilia]|uniref:Multidrug resistance protein Stp n=1 Tax=Stenotrophomonas maltophilia TaxID=40324 RepID=A0A7V8FFU8_STEMA|nr:MAG: Multidrug resistance protein Stp [Stenotrophomonas maltophilia]
MEMIQLPQEGDNGRDARPMSPQQRLIVGLLLGANFMLSADFSILNVALPEVSQAVGMSVHHYPWIATAFALPAAGLALLFGHLGDLYGLRRMFIIGMALLAAASILGGIATEPTLLLAARALQGISTAMTGPSALALLISAFPDDRQRARVLGLNGALLSGGFTFGALAGGMLVGVLSWRWSFFINVPIALAILFITPLCHCRRQSAQGRQPGSARRGDRYAGQIAIVYGFTELSLITFVLGAALLALFFWIERNAPSPLVAMDMLAWPSVRWGNVAILVIFAMESGLIYLVTIYLQEVLRLGPLATGLVFGVPGFASIVAGIYAGRLIGRRGARPVLLVAMLVQAGLTAPLVLLGADFYQSMWILIPSLLIGFFGHITAVVAATVAATTGIPEASKGLASGVMTTSQRVASTIGIPALAAVMAMRPDILEGIRLSLVVDVVLTVVAVALIAMGLRTRQIAAAQ